MDAVSGFTGTADGAPVELAHVQCRNCSQVGTLELEWRLEALPVGYHSLAGVQTKVSARDQPWLVCRSCGAECRGKRG